MRKILVTEPFNAEQMENIKEAAGTEFEVEQITEEAGTEALVAALAEAEIVVGQPELKYIRKPQKNCPNLKFVQMTWAGTDRYTLGKVPFPSDSVKLANASGAYGMMISQYVIGQLLALMQNFKGYYEQQEQGIWARRGQIKSLDKAKVLIYGAGDIGSSIAKRLQGFEAYTIGVCRNKDKYRPYFDRLVHLEDAQEYLGKADAVVCCIPNSEETAGYFNAEKLGMLKEGSVLVNVGRGNFIDCMALNEALNSGHIWGAALDVTDPEPLPAGHPLWSNPRCTITPHASGTTFGQLEATENLVCRIVCENISRYIKGDELKNEVY